MIWSQKSTTNPQNKNEYATVDDFRHIFTEDMNELYQLAFLLTADPQKAEKCFVAGVEDAVKDNHVFKDWARTWAKRTIIQNAIRELRPRPTLHESARFQTALYTADLPARDVKHFELSAVLALQDFDRFVFVMSCLAQYSEYSCALLLGCSTRAIQEGRDRALAQLAKASYALHSHELRLENVQEVVQ